MHTRAILTIGAALALTTTVQLRAQEMSNQPITVTGCLQPADAVHTGVSSAVAGTSGTDEFVLLDVRPGGEKASHASAANGQSSPASSTAGAATTGSADTATVNAPPKGPAAHEDQGPWYSVTGDTEGLRRRIGQRMEVSGTLNTV